MALTTLQFLAKPIIPWSSGWTFLLFGILIVMIICGTWTGAVAARKKRSMQWWFIIGFFLTIIGLIIVYSIKPLTDEQVAAIQKAKEAKKGG